MEATQGETLDFLVSLHGALPMTNQWLFNNAVIASSVGISNTWNFDLTLTNVQSSNAGSYQCIASNAYGSVTSYVVTLTVSP